jgi:hypothetical protein
MCHYITLIAPTDNAALVRSVMDRHGRLAEPIDNPSIRKILNNGEHQYLTTRGQCDCGTVLAPRADTSESFEEKLAKEAARMRRKGWSEAKISRALNGRRKADVRPHGGGSDSLELWNAVLSDLSRELKLPYAGLLVKFYAGAIATETFNASRREVAKNTPWRDALASMKHDEATIFRLS